MDKVRIVVSDPELITGQVRGIEPTMEELISESKFEIRLLAYLVTSGGAELLDIIEKAAKRGITVIIVINNLENQTKLVTERIKLLVSSNHNLKVYNFNGTIDSIQLHAKVLTADGERALVGSANITKSGMYRNYEIGVLIESERVKDLNSIIDTIIKKSKEITWPFDTL